MPTANPRINITVAEQTLTLLAQLAKQEGKSVAAMVKELMLEALERREDMRLSAVAVVRDIEAAPRKDHGDVWS